MVAPELKIMEIIPEYVSLCHTAVMANKIGSFQPCRLAEMAQFSLPLTVFNVVCWLDKTLVNILKFY